MENIRIKNEEIEELLGGEVSDFPKYTKQIINLANQNSKGTGPKVVGQLSDLIQEFNGKKLADWERWYKEKHPKAIDNATDKITSMIDNLREAMNEIDRSLVKKWTEDLIILKTFMGLRFQEAILKKISERVGKPYRLANPNEEAKGVDGFIGKTPVSIKPNTYKSKKGLSENIDVKIIYYEKKKDCLVVEYSNL